jgi:hypothetical protein
MQHAEGRASDPDRLVGQKIGRFVPQVGRSLRVPSAPVPFSLAANLLRPRHCGADVFSPSQASGDGKEPRRGITKVGRFGRDLGAGSSEMDGIGWMVRTTRRRRQEAS